MGKAPLLYKCRTITPVSKIRAADGIIYCEYSQEKTNECLG
ncbi:hypothetical protein CHCC14820_3349 [Bacillus paralicheniformis]|nr:hypothetical protein B4123_2988 [Bacillus paralicheniformis]TWJ50070.1 hypothetical protein CHCC5023_2116 [Bacillus paralicheniformis]TWJ61363.1 hypothetical protein CHCC5022_2629 [Bacillus paralicheniformis]TWJ79169.1 hypothetical protein CHCC4186_2938 [Bacillus paralicheniformis]TWJ82366.1 hypothetical protein CHCC5019_4317 [Bacillus paralicheniformis]